MGQTSKLCGPGASDEYETGLAQGIAGPPSRAQVNVTRVFGLENESCATRSVVPSVGPVSTKTAGASSADAVHARATPAGSVTIVAGETA